MLQKSSQNKNKTPCVQCICSTPQSYIILYILFAGKHCQVNILYIKNIGLNKRTVQANVCLHSSNS